MNVVVLIPAFNPTDSLLPLVKSITALGFQQIVVINDGSEASSTPIFEQAATMDHCTVLHHAINLGKGRALKTGFNYCCLEYPDSVGIVTADADGQHLPADILKVTAKFLSNHQSLVIGAREFMQGVPLRSLLGNRITRQMFKLLVGLDLSDTQSGLRCIPMTWVPDLIKLAGERYEYETNMLIWAKKSRTRILEETIITVYIQQNRSSHFNPLIDSLRICFLLLRFSVSSLLTSSIDFVIFTLVFLIQNDILTAMILARLVSGGINFMVNKSLVFHSKGRGSILLFKYFMLFISLAALSYLSIRTMADYGINVIAAKVLVESLLFLASFTIQRDFIFLNPDLQQEE